LTALKFSPNYGCRVYVDPDRKSADRRVVAFDKGVRRARQYMRARAAALPDDYLPVEIPSHSARG